MFKQLTISLLFVCFLLHVSAHGNHGGVRAGNYLIAIEPVEVEAGKETAIYVLIDYADNETGVEGLKVSLKLEACFAGTTSFCQAGEVGKGVYVFKTVFNQAGLKTVTVTFGNVTAVLPIHVRQANMLETILPRIAPYAIVLGVIATVALAVKKTRERKRPSSSK